MSLFRQAATLLLGTGAAQVLSLAALPLLTRLYAPADFGVFAFFAAIVMLAGPLICARLGFAVPIPAEEEEARDLLGVATRIGLTSSVLAAVGLATVHAGLVPGERLRDLPGWTSWIPASLFLTSLYQPFS